jgi:hypothetical protein
MLLFAALYIYDALCVVDEYKLFEIICEFSLGLVKKKERRKKDDE